MRYIVVQTKVAGLHHWPGGQPDFLQHPHRHEFAVRVEIEVGHAGRELEIITVQKDIDKWFLRTFPARGDSLLDFGSNSCEMIAEDLYDYIRAAYGGRTYDEPRWVRVEVLEDGVLGGGFSG